MGVWTPDPNENLLEIYAEPYSYEVSWIDLGVRVDDLASASAELQGRGLQFTGQVGEFEGTRWVHFVDLEGNL